MKIRQLPLLIAIAILFAIGPASADWKAGEAAYARGDYETAVQEFVKYVENEPHDPRYAGAYFRLGSCYLHLERLDEAEATANAALFDGFRVLAQRAGVSVDDLMERYLPEVVREGVEEVVAPAWPSPRGPLNSKMPPRWKNPNSSRRSSMTKRLE